MTLEEREKHTEIVENLTQRGVFREVAERWADDPDLNQEVIETMWRDMIESGIRAPEAAFDYRMRRGQGKRTAERILNPSTPTAEQQQTTARTKRENDQFQQARDWFDLLNDQQQQQIIDEHNRFANSLGQYHIATRKEECFPLVVRDAWKMEHQYQ